MNVDAAGVIAELLSLGHAVQFRAEGDSMHPVIRAGDVLHVERAASLRVGDVVLTRADRGLTVHRVVALRGGDVVTRGDNAPGDDAPLPRARVLGVVTHIERDGSVRGVKREAWFLRLLRRLRASLPSPRGAGRG